MRVIRKVLGSLGRGWKEAAKLMAPPVIAGM